MSIIGLVFSLVRNCVADVFDKVVLNKFVCHCLDTVALYFASENVFLLSPTHISTMPKTWMSFLCNKHGPMVIIYNQTQ